MSFYLLVLKTVVRIWIVVFFSTQTKYDDVIRGQNFGVLDRKCSNAVPKAVHVREIRTRSQTKSNREIRTRCKALQVLCPTWRSKLNQIKKFELVAKLFKFFFDKTFESKSNQQIRTFSKLNRVEKFKLVWN